MVVIWLAYFAVACLSLQSAYRAVISRWRNKLPVLPSNVVRANCLIRWPPEVAQRIHVEPYVLRRMYALSLFIHMFSLTGKMVSAGSVVCTEEMRRAYTVLV